MEVAISDLFAHPVLADLARVVESAGETALPAITPRRTRGAAAVVVCAAAVVVFGADGGSQRGVSHLRTGVRLKGALDAAALRRALDRIVARHEALRTRFVLVDGEPVQRIVPAEESRFHLMEHDLREQVDAQEELERVVAEEARAPLIWKRAADPRAADPAGGGRARTADHDAPHRLGRVVDGRVDEGVERAVRSVCARGAGSAAGAGGAVRGLCGVAAGVDGRGGVCGSRGVLGDGR